MSKEKILEAAREEFAEYGFSGARVDKIAKKAGINKAMLFYYFSSKENLYKSVLRDAAEKLMSQIKSIVTPELKAKTFLEKMPEIYIRYFSRNREIVKILGRELMNEDNYYKLIITELLENEERKTPNLIKQLINRWINNGEIVETDQFNLLMNIISLSVFSFMGKQIAEAVLGIKVKEDKAFFDKRIKSVSNLLKRGMLK